MLNDIFGACGNDLVIDDINVISLNTCSDTASFFINFFPVSVDLGLDQDTCTTDDIVLTANTAGAPGLSYQWFYNAVSQGPSTVGDDNFTVSSPNSGTYSVEVFNPVDLTCVASDEVLITYNLQPIANTPNDLFQCDPFVRPFFHTTIDTKSCGGLFLLGKNLRFQLVSWGNISCSF